MLITAMILFLIAAFFGSIILMAILKNRKTPGPVVFVHGVFAIFGLLLAIAYTATHPSTLLIVCVTLLVIAALGGLFLLTIDMSHKPIPKLFAVFHPLLALTGVTVLFVYIYQHFLS